MPSGGLFFENTKKEESNSPCNTLSSLINTPDGRTSSMTEMTETNKGMEVMQLIDNYNNSNINVCKAGQTPNPKQKQQTTQTRTPSLPINSKQQITPQSQLLKNKTKNKKSAKSHSSSGSSSVSKSYSKRCRYCFEHIPISENVSCCHCRGILCQKCLESEISMLYSSKRDRMTECTVCKVCIHIFMDIIFIVFND